MFFVERMLIDKTVFVMGQGYEPVKPAMGGL